MKIFARIFVKMEKIFVSAIMAVMTIVIFAATITRYTALTVIPWSEELARYLMIWLGLIGAGSVARDGGHFGVDIVVKAVPEKARKMLYVLQAIIITGFCAYAGWFGVKNVIGQYSMGQKSPAMQIPMYLLYAAVPLGSFSVMVQNLIYYIPLIFEKK